MQWDFHRRSGKLNKKDRERGKTTWERWNDENMKGHIKMIAFGKEDELEIKVKISEMMRWRRSEWWTITEKRPRLLNC